MGSEVQICPCCGTYVQARKMKSYTNKVARQSTKSAVHMATSMGGMGTGALIGSSIFPGVGTIIGGALGFVGSAMFNQAVNEGIDTVADELTDFELEFSCPKCGKTWKDGDLQDDSNEDYEDDYEDGIIDIQQEHGVILGNTRGLILHVKFCISGCKGQECTLVVYPEYKNDKNIIDTNFRYRDSSGNVSFQSDFKPQYDDSIYNDYQIFIPYAELHLHRSQEIKLLVGIISESGVKGSSQYTYIDWSGDSDDYINIYHELNVTDNDENGMMIHTHFEIEGMNQKKGMVVVAFYYSTDYSQCEDENGENIYRIEEYSPGYDSALYEDFQIFVPYSILGYVNEAFYYQVIVFNDQQEVVLKSNPSNNINWE